MPERQFQCWYVNIGKPLKRTAEGFETTDLALDVVIRPDFTWYWKDEDEFAKLIEMGYYSEEFAAEIRNVGLAAIEQLESRSTPFDESWPDWSPPSNWNVPEFRPSWVEGLE
jgi:protein associated with RNAse G/E